MNDRIPGINWDNPIWYRDKWRIYLSDDCFSEYVYVHDDVNGAIAIVNYVIGGTPVTYEGPLRKP